MSAEQAAPAAPLLAPAKVRAEGWLEARRRVPPDGQAGREWWAIGDPQASFDRLIGVLAGARLLGDDGALRPEVGLVSMGDHFDFDPKGQTLDWVGEQGVLILGWLASHPPDQVAILLGNHDVARVQELAFESDQSFVAARDLARQIGDPPAGPMDADLMARFHREHPRIPNPGIAKRDYSSFSVRQRALVQRLLLDGRFALAAAAMLREGAPALLTHAGVTARELRLLGAENERDVSSLAAALQGLLAKGIDPVRAAWGAGELCALDLRELHVAGVSGREGHGMLYHRPADPDRAGVGDKVWEFDAQHPRRFTPRDLPLGLVQVVGHVGHSRCLKEMPTWTAAAAHTRPRGGLRTLTFDGRDVVYRSGLHSHRDGMASVYMIDPELCRDDAHPWELFQLGGLIVGPADRTR